MAIKYTPAKRFINQREVVTYAGLNLLAQGTAVIEPGTVGINEWVAADIAAILTSQTVGANESVVFASGTTVAAGTKVLLADAPDAPVGSIPDDMVYVQQRNSRVLFSGFIQIINAVAGATKPVVRFFAHNVSTTAETLGAGGFLFYKVQLGKETTPTPTVPAALTLVPGTTWAAGDPVTQAKLNLTATPVASIPAGAVGAQETNSADLRTLAARNVGRRATFTVPSAISVPVGDAVLVGTLGFSPLIGTIAFVSQPFIAPIFTAWLVTNTSVSIYARNNTFGTVSVPAGTILKVVIV